MDTEKKLKYTRYIGSHMSTDHEVAIARALGNMQGNAAKGGEIDLTDYVLESVASNYVGDCCQFSVVVIGKYTNWRL